MVVRHGLRRGAHAAGQPAIVADIEGLDFLGMRARLNVAPPQRGTPSAQLVHDAPNGIGNCERPCERQGRSSV
jgi:hypothetical protein